MFFDSKTFLYIDKVETSKGMFHMWPSKEQKQIFAVADEDRVVDVVSINRFDNKIASHKKTINIGSLFKTGKPHDVVVDDNFVFVTMIGVEEGNLKFDYLVKYSKKTLKYIDKKRFSFDIHLGIPNESPYLLLPEQTAGRLNFIDKNTLKIVTTVENLPGAHGIFWNADASKIYLSNFSIEGNFSIYEVRQKQGSFDYEAEKVNMEKLSDARAHNITADFESQTLFVTHSGANHDQKLNRNISVFSIKGDLKFIKTVETGANPLGILFVNKLN